MVRLVGRGVLGMTSANDFVVSGQTGQVGLFGMTSATADQAGQAGLFGHDQRDH